MAAMAVSKLAYAVIRMTRPAGWTRWASAIRARPSTSSMTRSVRITSNSSRPRTAAASGPLLIDVTRKPSLSRCFWRIFSISRSLSTTSTWGVIATPPCPRGATRRTWFPEPGVFSTRISPSRLLTMSGQIGRPSPVPSPGGLVLKNGSKIRGRIAAGMPAPLSLTVISTPGRTPRVTERAMTRTAPVGRAASNAFIRRLIRTCWS